MDIKIIVATHKKYWMPDDPMYLPVHVGAAGKESIGYQRDDEGENISKKNPNYCELTGLYWAWKNLNADYIGLAHYRRHFSNGKMFGDKKQKVIDATQMEQKLKDIDILLPTPRNYWIETNYSQYAHAHHAIDLDTTRDILKEKYPQYIAAWDSSMKKTTGHRFNMFVMKKELFDQYCEWMFDVLFELENRLDISTYNQYDRRVFGFVSERLLDVWIETNELSYKNTGYVFMESQNWFIKGGRFIKRKMLKRNI
ncbi:DUF4422 domain-containing protein [Clostridiales bacterium]|nr:DUF4422 domain-containing protein [Clostridiales bacterium]